MKQSNNQTVLAVAAHPDDIDFAAGGTIAKWIKEGAIVYYLILTDGGKGTSDPKMSGVDLVRVRHQEQQAAADILGVKKVFFANHKDCELKADLALKKQITEIIRKLKPAKVLTMNPATLYSIERNFVNHTDHREAGLAAMDSVFPLARDRLTFPEHQKKGLMPHKVRELYMVCFTFADGNFVCDITKTFDLKMQAIRAHQSQVDKSTIEKITNWNRQNGQKAHTKYAEIFVRLELP